MQAGSALPSKMTETKSTETTVINTGLGAIKLSCAANLIQIEYALTNAIAQPHHMDLGT